MRHFDPIQAAGPLKEGRLRALAISAKDRFVSLPPTIGWRDVWAYYERTVGFLGKISVKSIDPRIQVNGSCAWVIAREEIGNDSCAKDGTLISSRPTMSTNVFEKANGEWRMVSHHAQEILSV
jgi:hypothetical protein